MARGVSRTFVLKPRSCRMCKSDNWSLGQHGTGLEPIGAREMIPDEDGASRGRCLDRLRPAAHTEGAAHGRCRRWSGREDAVTWKGRHTVPSPFVE